MVAPDYFFAEVGDIKTDLTHTINVRETVPPIVNLFYGCVPIVIAIGLIVLYTMVAIFGIPHFFTVGFIKVSAYVTICH